MELRSPIAAFRAILIAVCAVLASVPGAEHRALFLLGGLGLSTWVMFRLHLNDRQREVVAYGEACVAGASVAVSGGAASPLLPYLLAPALALGILAGARAVLLGGAAAVVALAGVHAVVGRSDDVQNFVVTAGQWVLLGGAVGLVATWARALAAMPRDRSEYEEARALLERLRTVSRGLPAGLDAGAAADALLEEAAKLAPSQRSGVLVQTVAGGALVPLAVRGVRRVPWRTPLSEPGPLRTAWDTQQPVVDRRKPDVEGRRTGSALAVVPLCGSSEPFGLVVLESRDLDAFNTDEIEALSAAAQRVALRLETSLLFDDVRSLASAEERTRLAREMHDGVAQDLAFVGYRLDSLRNRAAALDEPLAADVGALRKEITDLISNLRLSITDLRTSVSGDRGLGAALTAYIRAVAAGRGLTVHLSLQESPFRLPPEREVALFRVAQLVAQDVRETGHANDLWVTLRVDPPSARLTVEHNGRVQNGGHDIGAVADVLRELGGRVEMRPRNGGGASVEATFGGEDDGDGDPGPAG